MTNYSLERVLITGGAVRIGREIALALSKAGAAIAIHCHHSQKEAKALAALIRKRDGGACVVPADLTNEKAIAALVSHASEKLGGPLTCLINNASVFEKDTLDGFTRLSWQKHMDVNFYAPLLLAKYFAQQACYRKRLGEAQSDGVQTGNIINLLDGIWGWSMSHQFMSYTLSKIGLWQATELLAKELAPRIRVNGIALGPTLEGTLDKDDTFAKLRHVTPLKRISSPAEVCDTIAYLLNAPSVTGQIIQLGAGLHLK